MTTVLDPQAERVEHDRQSAWDGVQAYARAIQETLTSNPDLGKRLSKHDLSAHDVIYYLGANAAKIMEAQDFNGVESAARHIKTAEFQAFFNNTHPYVHANDNNGMGAADRLTLESLRESVIMLNNNFVYLSRYQPENSFVLQ